MIRDIKNFQFYSGGALGYFKPILEPLTPDVNIPYSKIKGSYIKINGVTYVEGAIDSFVEYKFKLNRQGGADSSIKFNSLSGVFKIGDSVEYYLNGVKKFSGYVSSIEDNGLSLKVVPLWYKLKNQTIQGSLILESTLDVYTALVGNKQLVGLKEKIKEIGIKFNDSDIDTKYKNYNVTCSYSGRNLVDILDDIVSNCSSSTVWGVDVNGLFYFKEFSEEPIDMLSWYNNDFVDSEYTRDGSDLYTAYVVKRKAYQSDETETLPLRVGIERGVPPAFIEEIGLRVGLFEYPFSVSVDDVAYDYVQEQLLKQFFKESTNIKKINKDIEINKAYKIVCKAVENYYRDIDLTNIVDKQKNNKLTYESSFVIECDDCIDTSYIDGLKFSQSTIDLITIDDYYLRACNEALDIKYIYVYWHDNKIDNPANSCIINVNDGNIKRSFNSINGIVKLDCRDMDKRHIKINSSLDSIVYDKMRVYFNQGSKVVTQNAINIEYNYKNGILDINADFSRLNIALTNYFFNEAKKIKDLNQLFTSN